MRKERLIDVEVIPFNNFKEKMKLTKKYQGKGKIRVMDEFIYIERCKYE